MFRTLIFMFLLTPTSNAESYSNIYESYFTIDQVTVTKEYEELSFDFQTYATKNDCSEFSMSPLALSESNLSIEDIVNVGKEVWKIIEANKPVVTVDMPVAHAMPKGIQCWTDLEQWQSPKAVLYRIQYKNLFGITVVDFNFRVSYVYGGSYLGKGQYLANVSVVPATLDVAWGFNVNATSVVGQTVNLGTKDNPEAGISLSVRWHIKTVAKDSDNTENFFIRANGDMQRL